MTGAAPWWASDDHELDRDQDPLAAHVAARGLGLVEDADDAPDDATDDATDDPGGRSHANADDEPDDGVADAPSATSHDPAICGVCPVCRGWTGLQDRHPDVAAHLAEAARHVALALTSFADAVDRGSRPDAARDDTPRTTDFTDIPLDDDRPAAP